jgi:hypothetical protein
LEIISMYVPNNTPVYLAAFAGALAGLGAPNQPIVDVDNSAEMADAFAQALDTVWGVTTYTQLDLLELQVCCEDVWSTRSPLPAPASTTPVDYDAIVTEIIALVRAGTAQVESEGIDPDGGTPVPTIVARAIGYVDGTYTTYDVKSGFDTVVEYDPTGAAAVIFPSSPTIGQQVTVAVIGDAMYNLTLNGNGFNVQSLTDPGVFAPTATLTTGGDESTATWTFDGGPSKEIAPGIFGKGWVNSS